MAIANVSNREILPTDPDGRVGSIEVSHPAKVVALLGHICGSRWGFY